MLAMENETLTRIVDGARQESQHNLQYKGKLEITEEQLRFALGENQRLVAALGDAQLESDRLKLASEAIAAELQHCNLASEKQKQSAQRLKKTLEGKIEDCFLHLQEKFERLQKEFAGRMSKFEEAGLLEREEMGKRLAEISSLKSMNDNL